MLGVSERSCSPTRRQSCYFVMAVVNLVDRSDTLLFCPEQEQ